MKFWYIPWIEFIKFFIHNNIMKKIIWFILVINVLNLPVNRAFAADKGKNPQSFSELGNYVQTYEINDDENKEEDKLNSDTSFEDEAIYDVEKRYEKNAVELNLDDIDEKAINTVNKGRIYKLEVNETHYNLENKIKNENMIWDDSKNFSRSYMTSDRHLAPIPSVVNSQSLNVDISGKLSASIGQTTLHDSLGSSVLFVRGNESTYNVGSVVSYKGDALNLSVGSFASSYNNASSGGAILSSNAIKLPHNSGSLKLGSGVFKNDKHVSEKTTGGFFGEYEYKRLKLNAQVGQNHYSNNTAPETSLYFVPEYKLSDSLSLKTRLIRNVTQNNMQDELALTYKPKKSKNNMEFEINASRQYSENEVIKQRLKFSTTFRI